MGTVKATCPVCGRDFRADSSASGTEIECPACHQKIVVQQACVSDSAQSVKQWGPFRWHERPEWHGRREWSPETKLACWLTHDFIPPLRTLGLFARALGETFAPGTSEHEDLALIRKLIEHAFAPVFLTEKSFARFWQFLAAFVQEKIEPVLAATRATIDTLENTLVPDSEAYDDLVRMRRVLAHLAENAKFCLDFAGSSAPNLVLTAVPSFLSELGALVSPYLSALGIRLELKSEPDLRICADPDQLKQVVNELIQNAADSIGQNGTITLRAAKGELVLRGRPTRVVLFEVEDTGAGIDLRYCHFYGSIFLPCGSPKKGGRIGLGLARSATIIDNHGGVLSFEPQRAAGALFRVALPAEPPFRKNE